MASSKLSSVGFVLVEELEFDDAYVVSSGIVSRLVEVRRGVRGKLRNLVRRASRLEACRYGVVYAIDTAFPPAPWELLGLSLSLISYGWVRVRDCRLDGRYCGSRVLVDFLGEVEQDYVASTARLLERRLALEVLEGDEVDVLVFDGEVLPYRALKGGGRWVEVYDLSLKVLERARRRGVVVVGIVKRSYSMMLSDVTGVRMNDKAVLTAVLSRGEYIVLEHPLRVLKEYGCQVVFYKPFRGVGQAVKAEVCGPQRLVDDVVSFLASEASPTALPWFIDTVDDMVRRELSKLDMLVRLIQASLARLEEGHPILASPTNLQKPLRGSQQTP